MNTFLYSYLVVIIIATVFLAYVHRAKLITAYKWLAKELAETGKNAGAVIRH